MSSKLLDLAVCTHFWTRRGFGGSDMIWGGLIRIYMEGGSSSSWSTRLTIYIIMYMSVSRRLLRRRTKRRWRGWRPADCTKRRTPRGLRRIHHLEAVVVSVTTTNLYEHLVALGTHRVCTRGSWISFAGGHTIVAVIPGPCFVAPAASEHILVSLFTIHRTVKATRITILTAGIVARRPRNSCRR